MNPPTMKRRLFTQRPVILRFFSTSFRRLKCSMRHTKVAWWLSAALVALRAFTPDLACADPAIRLGACRRIHPAHRPGAVTEVHGTSDERRRSKLGCTCRMTCSMGS